MITAAKAQELATLLQRLDDERDAKKQAVRDFNASLKAIEDQIRMLAGDIKMGGDIFDRAAGDGDDD